MPRCTSHDRLASVTRCEAGELRVGNVPCSVVPNANEDNEPTPSASPAHEQLSAAQRRAVSELLRVSPVADDLARRFQEAGFRLALVGGSVRDALLGRLGNDLDFTTDARPEDVLKHRASVGGRRVGGRDRLRHGGLPEEDPRRGSDAKLPDRGHHLPVGGVRQDLAQAGGLLRRLHRGGPGPP